MHYSTTVIQEEGDEGLSAKEQEEAKKAEKELQARNVSVRKESCL